ncbi:flagellar hook-basal body complex protein FliE [Aliarcobacter butzleri]
MKGYDSMKEIATGKVVNLQEAVQKIEEAELTMKLALEVKNKAINAYREVMRMQV